MIYMEEKLPLETDWEGNVIHEGDILVVYNLITQLAPGELDIFVDEDGIERMEVRTPNFAWRRFMELEVFLIAGILQIQIPNVEATGPGDEMIWCPVRMLMEMQEDPFVAFCIKGKSDNEERFYRHFFRPFEN